MLDWYLDAPAQPSIISLFSSTASLPLLLASNVQSSTTATSDSFVSLLHDRTDGEETLISFNGEPSELSQRARSIVRRPLEDPGGQDLRSRVMHLQDPDCRTTSVRWGTLRPERANADGLGIELEYFHLQVKNLGQNFYFDVSVANDLGQTFVFRCSTFQQEPKLHPATDFRPAMLHLPLAFPPPTPTLLTSWSTITLPLSNLLSSLPKFGVQQAGRFSSVLGVEVHANCRIRRIWFSNDGKEADEWMARKGLMSELALYAAELG
ncbi:uncharacterized protein JCM15063_005813 [Sporobolomyces koalae]|uniref:uncharacterized protein n=1 Tax=Sporobolomyces koalae TaxID=500713 RepID=UPI00317240C8